MREAAAVLTGPSVRYPPAGPLGIHREPWPDLSLTPTPGWGDRGTTRCLAGQRVKHHTREPPPNISNGTIAPVSGQACLGAGQSITPPPGQKWKQQQNALYGDWWAGTSARVLRGACSSCCPAGLGHHQERRRMKLLPTAGNGGGGVPLTASRLAASAKIRPHQPTSPSMGQPADQAHTGSQAGQSTRRLRAALLASGGPECVELRRTSARPRVALPDATSHCSRGGGSWAGRFIRADQFGAHMPKRQRAALDTELYRHSPVRQVEAMMRQSRLEYTPSKPGSVPPH